MERNAVVKGKYLEMLLRSDDGELTALKADPIIFDAYDSPALAADLDKGRIRTNKKHPPFDFGYVLTVHSAQGSEWEKVLVWDDCSTKQFDKDGYAKWLYTAITRGQKNVIIAA